MYYLYIPLAYVPGEMKNEKSEDEEGEENK